MSAVTMNANFAGARAASFKPRSALKAKAVKASARVARRSAVVVAQKRDVKVEAAAAEASVWQGEKLVSKAGKYYKVNEDNEELIKGLNPQEKYKLKFGEGIQLLDSGEIQEMADFCRENGFEALDKRSKDDASKIDLGLKWLGFFHRRKGEQNYGTFMSRLKLPNGVATSAQLRVLGNIMKKYEDAGNELAVGDITTRQNFQIRGIKLEDIPDIMAQLQEVGLWTIQSGMDNVRNVVGNPLAGVDPEEILDTRPMVKRLNDYVISAGEGNRDITNLPRKWNPCVVGTHDLWEHPHINDLAFVPAEVDGKVGFNVLVGGFLSSKRSLEAISMDAWVPEEDMVDVMDAVLGTFRDYGARKSRQASRMMYLVEEMGLENFRAEVASRMPSKTIARAAAEDLIQKDWERRTVFGVHKQKQDGLNWIGGCVSGGRLTAQDFLDMADVADEFGSGEVRLTVEQNFCVIDIPDDKVEQALKAPIFERHPTAPGAVAAGMVACTGSQFCPQSIIETKVNAKDMVAQLEATLHFPAPIRMHWTGCPNTCAQVQVADLGFMGTKAKGADGKPTDGVDIFVGGRVGSDSHIGDKVATKVPIDENLLGVVQELCIEHFGASLK